MDRSRRNSLGCTIGRIPSSPPFTSLSFLSSSIPFVFSPPPDVGFVRGGNSECPPSITVFFLLQSRCDCWFFRDLGRVFSDVRTRGCDHFRSPSFDMFVNPQGGSEIKISPSSCLLFFGVPKNPAPRRVRSRFAPFSFPFFYCSYARFPCTECNILSLENCRRKEHNVPLPPGLCPSRWIREITPFLPPYPCPLVGKRCFSDRPPQNSVHPPPVCSEGRRPPSQRPS